ncbi:MAG: sigma-70 family RNA polymerase sigma factor [Clostridia bacterium]|nr:sigma-70 family RNA polymerase sigma factor [Clostridia bacterium]
MEDSKIIILYNQRDEAAIAETQTKYGAYCFTIAANILHSLPDSEECVNDTWLRAWNAIPPEKPNSLRAFLGRITRNLAFDRYRSRRSAQRGGDEVTLALEELSDCIASRDTVEGQAELRALGESIDRFLSELSVRDRNVFLCRYYYTYSTAEIAAQLGLRENYLRNLLSRLRIRLQKHLEKEGFEL